MLRCQHGRPTISLGGAIIVVSIALIMVGGCRRLLSIDDTCAEGQAGCQAARDGGGPPAADAASDCDDDGDCASGFCGEDGFCQRCTSADDCPTGSCHTGTGECVAAEDVLFVNGDGTDTVGCGDADEAACKTIAYALEQLLVRDEKRVIQLRAGETYSDGDPPLVPATESVTLLADGANIFRDETAPVIELGADSTLSVVGGTFGGALPPHSGIRCGDDSALVVMDADIGNNGGDGIDCDGIIATVEVYGSEIHDNEVNGIVVAGAATPIPLTNESVVIENNVIEHNGSLGIAMNGGTTAAPAGIRGNRIRDNYNGGIAINAMSAHIVNNFVVSNHLPTIDADNPGIAVTANAGQWFRVEFNTVADNSTQADAGGLVCTGTASFDSTHNLLYGNTGVVPGDTYPAALCDTSFSYGRDLPAGQNNLDAAVLTDPAFEGGARPYFITESSPCFNAGDPLAAGVSVDIEGDSRSLYGDPDCGADEVATTP